MPSHATQSRGFVYLVVAVMDRFSRYVLSWALSLTLDVDFCLEALRDALRRGRPEIFNSGQGFVVHQRTLHRRVGGPGHRDRHGCEGGAWTQSSPSDCGAH